MKLIIAIAAILLPLLHLNAQTIKPLAIGDRMPGIALTPLLNYSLTKINTSGFNDKLVIVDFFTTGCAACIKAMPGLDSLQKAFSGRVQVLLVTPEQKERAIAFLKRKNIAALNLALLAEDTILARLFPYTYAPHEVVINNGMVAAITYPEYINAGNIQAIINGKTPSFVVKRDVATFQYEKPLVLLNEAIIPDFSFPSDKIYSIVTSHMNNLKGRLTTVKDSVTGTRRVSIINLPILDMYIRTLYGDELRPAFISLAVADMERYVYKKEDGYLHDWRVKNTYCYEGTFSLSFNEEDVKRKIAADLDFYFRLHGRMEKRSIQCLIISRDSLATSHNNGPADLFKEGEVPRPVSINSIIFYLNGDFGNTPAIDETGEGGLAIHGLDKNDYTNIPVLQQKLKQYGLQLTKATRLVDMLVVTENEPN